MRELDLVGCTVPGELKDHTIACPDCSGAMKLKPSRYGLFYACTQYPECKGTHRALPNGDPAGIPGDAATRRARSKVMFALEELDRLDLKGLLFDLCAIAGAKDGTLRVGLYSKETCDLLLEEMQKALREKGLLSLWDRLGDD